MTTETVEMAFPRPEAWVVHHALVAAAGRSAADAAVTDEERGVSQDAAVAARHGIERGRTRFTRREADAVRAALAAYLAGGPLRDQKPGGDALRRVRRRLGASPERSAGPRRRV